LKIKHLKYESPDWQVNIDWMITLRCNYSCSYCTAYDNTKPLGLKSLEEYIDSFSYLSEYFGNQRIRINFLGGEPTLFKQWVELVNWLSDHNYLPNIITNLSIPAKNYIHKLNGKAKKFISASYHPEMVKLEDFYKNAELLQEAGYLDSVTLLADPNDWDNVLRIYDKLSEVCTVLPLQIQNEFSGNYSLSENIVEYTEEQMKFFDQAFKDASNSYVKLDTGDEVIHPSIEHIKVYYNKFKGMKCAVGRDKIHIKYTGDVYPSGCLLNYPRACMGNLYEKNLIKPKGAITCPFNQCPCSTDIRIEKWTQE
jgi:sulfatase maturation enzyme AslB (radical SAM superfamily)